MRETALHCVLTIFDSRQRVQANEKQALEIDILLRSMSNEDVG